MTTDHPPPRYSDKIDDMEVTVPGSAAALPPPATSTDTAAQHHILCLRQVKPGRITAHGAILSGSDIRTMHDVIMLSTSISYVELVATLHNRVLAQFGADAPYVNRAGTFVRTKGGVEICVTDEGSWRASRGFLKGGAGLEFVFAEVPKGYAGGQKGFRKMCSVQ